MEQAGAGVVAARKKAGSLGVRTDKLQFTRKINRVLPMHKSLNLEQAAVAQFCRQHRIRRLALFGSQMKGTARPDSDIDLLVEFNPDGIPGLFGIAAMEQQLSAMLGGRKVDLRTEQDLSRHFRDEVVRTAEVQYAQ